MTNIRKKVKNNSNKKDSSGDKGSANKPILRPVDPRVPKKDSAEN